MKYDFTTILDRSGYDCLAVNKIPGGKAVPQEGFSIIPMWVADMNFPTAPSVLNAIKRRLEMPSLGYFVQGEACNDAIIQWHATRKGVCDITRENIGFENGVLAGLASAIMAFTCPGDSVLLHTPVYAGFIHTIEDLGRNIVYSQLVKDDQGIWRMDFADMDMQIKNNKIHFAIFCTPHNPCGRVWERWEVEKAMETYAANDCLVVTDEIWSDIVMPGYAHIPPQSISEDAKNRTIALYAPSKTFSIAGLIGAYHVVYNPYLRDRLKKQGDICQYNKPNILSMYALIGAYSEEGAQWADEMISVIEGNIDFACSFIENNFPGISCMRPQGTYMLYLDCEEYCNNYNVAIDTILCRGIEKGVLWQDGSIFGKDNTIRLNLALPLSLVEEAMERLKTYVFYEVCR